MKDLGEIGNLKFDWQNSLIVVTSRVEGQVSSSHKYISLDSARDDEDRLLDIKNPRTMAGVIRNS